MQAGSKPPQAKRAWRAIHEDTKSLCPVTRMHHVSLGSFTPMRLILAAMVYRYFMMPLLHLPLWFVEMVVRATSVDLLPKPARTAQG